jgi:ABC-2 type transport system ATP-binding protein
MRWQLRAQAAASAYRLTTSDDDAALDLAQRHQGVGAVGSDRGGLELTVEEGCLDGYVLALGHAGVAIRRLEVLASPVETLFFALTGGPEAQLATGGRTGERAMAET